MKKAIVILLIIFLLLLAAIYVFIPGKLTVSSAGSYAANREAVYRFLTKDSNWQRWWPGAVLKKEKVTSFMYDGYIFQIDKILYDLIHLKLEGDSYSGQTVLKVVSYDIENVKIEISTELATGTDPFSRASGYFRARKIKRMFNAVITALQTYTGDLKNMYGINIKKEKVQYQYLVSTKQSFSHYPSTGDIYAVISKLREHINKARAQELFSPMLNIQMTDSATYLVQIGLPVDKDLPNKGDIASKWMMKGGNILTAEVTGAPQQVEKASKQFEQYILDHRRTIVAIPFQVLITDRSKEPDSTKWITLWHYPVV